MATPFLGEIRLFAGNFAPVGWALCNGAILPIQQYQALFALLGTTYGGNGTTDFALPDLQGRVPVHTGSGFVMGQAGGAETVTVLETQAPTHTHPWAVDQRAASADTEKLPGGYLANGPLLAFDNSAAPSSAELAASTIGSAGGGQPHENMAPFVVITFIIALQGIFPSQN